MSTRKWTVDEKEQEPKSIYLHEGTHQTEHREWINFNSRCCRIDSAKNMFQIYNLGQILGYSKSHHTIILYLLDHQQCFKAFITTSTAVTFTIIFVFVKLRVSV